MWPTRSGRLRSAPAATRGRLGPIADPSQVCAASGHLGFDPEGYIGRNHPVQELVTAAIEEFTEVEWSAFAPTGQAISLRVTP